MNIRDIIDSLELNYKILTNSTSRLDIVGLSRT